jgi:hypothetical protein
MLMTRSEELAAIDAFVADHGVTPCPSKYALSSINHLPMLLAAQRLAELKVSTSDKYSWLAVAQRIFFTWAGRR